MAETPNYIIKVFRNNVDLPLDTEDIFGNGVLEAWERKAPEPVLIGGLTDTSVLVGGIFMLLEGDNHNRVASIWQFIVRPEHWGRGLGGRLLRFSIDFATELGCQRIRSTAGWGCEDHLVLYDRLHFQRVSDERPYLVTRALHDVP